MDNDTISLLRNKEIIAILDGDTKYGDYEFEDYTLAPGARIKFRFEGTISMQRNINTQIPDKDQAIEWD